MEAGNRNDARIRGNAQQLLEKYKTLARDATAAGDRILAEYYMQHADHYYRVLAEFRSRYEDTRSRDRDDRDTDDVGYDEDTVEVTAAPGYAQPVLSIEPAADAAEDAKPASVEAPVADEAAAAEAGADAAEGEEAPRRRRRGRPRKVKADSEGESAGTAENAA